MNQIGPPWLSAGAIWSARLVLACVAVYVAIDISLVFLRPEFSVLHNAESDYGSRGPWAWLMDLNFVLRCVLSLLTVRAVLLASTSHAKGGRVRAGVVLVSVWAIASGLLAFFPDDPAGTAIHPAGRLHLALAFVAFVAVLIGTPLISLALSDQPVWKRVTVPMLAASFGALVPLLLLVRTHFRITSLGGLYEKIFLAMELLWMAIVTAPLGLHRADRADRPDRPR
ncbi:MAG TPA: DUF998 domain-containing protein [Acidimicrobiales bacterium]|nr:DUF998 domain-containing protein [Acidimicrobiales bacterium]